MIRTVAVAVAIPLSSRSELYLGVLLGGRRNQHQPLNSPAGVDLAGADVPVAVQIEIRSGHRSKPQSTGIRRAACQFGRARRSSLLPLTLVLLW